MLSPRSCSESAPSSSALVACPCLQRGVGAPSNLTHDPKSERSSEIQRRWEDPELAGANLGELAEARLDLAITEPSGLYW